jgi:hypothetical protein
MRNGFGRHARSIRLFALAILLAGLAGGCGAVFNERPGPDLWSPFETESNWVDRVNDGSVTVRISGFTRGHSPGLTSSFRIRVENQTSRPLDSGFCIYVVDEIQVVQRVMESEISLEPATGTIRLIRATFDADLAPRAYGFAVVVEDWGAVVSTIRLGIADDPAGPWLEAATLECVVD